MRIKFAAVSISLLLFLTILFPRSQSTAQATSPDLPKGSIIAWYATSGTIPNGWAICDGSNGTPDLRGKFLIGVATLADVGHAYGNETHTHLVSGSTSDAFGHPDPFKHGDDRGCCPQVTGLAHAHSVNFQSGPGSSIPPSISVIYLMKK